MDENIRREIILDNYQNPYGKEKEKDDSYIKINTNNESCIDNLDIYFKVEDSIIKDVSFNGEACAISTSATSIMLKSIIGKSTKEAKSILENYKKMINEETYDENLLKELIVYKDIQPNRKGCALLPGKAIERLIESLNEN